MQRLSTALANDQNTAHQAQQQLLVTQLQTMASNTAGAAGTAAAADVNADLAVNAPNRILHLKDLPQFSGSTYDDPVDFVMKFEMIAKVHNWSNDEKIKHFALAVQRNALKWYESNQSLPQWDGLKADFLKASGKNQFELELCGETGKMLASEGPLGYVFSTLGYIKNENPTAADKEKTIRQISSLPKTTLKAYFVHNTSQTVQQVTDSLKEVATEQAFQQSAGPNMGLHGNAFQTQLSVPGLLQNPFSDASALNALATSQTHLLHQAAKPVVVPSFSNLSTAILAQQVLDIVSTANKDLKLKQTQDELEKTKAKKESSISRNRQSNFGSTSQQGNRNGCGRGSGQRFDNFVAPDVQQIRHFCGTVGHVQ